MLRRKEVGLRQWAVQRQPFTRRERNIPIGWVSIKLSFISQSSPVLFKIKFFKKPIVAFIERTKSEREKQISYINTYIWNLENGTNEPNCRAAVEMLT